MYFVPAPFVARQRRSAPARGLTMIELLVTIAVLVVVMTVAGPAMSEFTANNQVVAAKSGFAAAVGLARTEAARRGQAAIVRPLGSGNDPYASGWEVVVDENGDGVAGNAETRVRRYPAPPSTVRLAGPASLIFRASGALQGSSAENFTVCRRDGGEHQGFSVIVTPSGAADIASTDECNQTPQ